VENFFNYDVIIVMSSQSSVNGTQSVCVLLSPQVICHKSQVTNSSEVRKNK